MNKLDKCFDCIFFNTAQNYCKKLELVTAPDHFCRFGIHRDSSDISEDNKA